MKASKQRYNQTFKKYVKMSDSLDGEIVFTPAALLELLSKIDEFKEFDLSLTENMDGTLQLQVGDSFYELASDESVNDIQVDESVVEEISDINEEAYEDLMDDDFTDSTLEPVESGIIKEALKTLLIGGIVRMGKQYLTH